jgi:mRNA interferase RelE/StbE
MQRYTIEFKASADKALLRLPEETQRRIVAAVDKLADSPHPPGVKKLAGEPNAWRIRIGDYRVLYDIHDDRLLILVVGVGHRKDIYR